jgi:hypothetical protein
MESRYDNTDTSFWELSVGWLIENFSVLNQ